MIEACKVCETKIPVPQLGVDWWCHKCQVYSIVCTDGIVESELIRSGDFFLTFLPTYKTASVVSTEKGKWKQLRTLEMDELTHEQAVYWVAKLKSYLVFS